MESRSLIALCLVLSVGSFIYASQPPAEVSSSSSSSSSFVIGSSRPKKEISTLQQLSATKIAQMLHDQEMVIDVQNMPADPQSRATAMNNYFPGNQSKLIAEAYYRLYPAEFKPQRLQVLKEAGVNLSFNVDGSELFAISNRKLLRWFLDNGLFKFAGETIFTTSNHSPILSEEKNRLAIEMLSQLHIFNRQKDNSLVGPQIIASNPGRHVPCMFSPDGRIFISDNNKNIQIWSQDLHNTDEKVTINPYTLLQTLSITDLNMATFGISNNLLATYSSTTHTLSIWSRDTGNAQFRRIKEVRGEMYRHPSAGIMVPETSILTLAFSPDEKLLAITDFAYQITIMKGINFSDKEIVTAPNGDIRNQANAVMFLPNNSSIFVSLCGGSGPVKIWAEDPSTHIFRLRQTVTGVYMYQGAISPNGDYMAVAPAGGRGIEIWRLKPTLQDIWNHILEHTDMPELEEGE